ncbi:hypothetical protein [Chryseobacterium gallinarum]|uniref:Phage portal protein n=1 Tax=Chryseobacterium gallinarum TaxID=1324352 RepID=A0ABX6KR28_CHRGL|nr:hypothetical protein [Chryseobacterium gallinarum]QIY91079.1 hypothetical protein FOB44_10640 [Chryseobacterium gallinarum]
MTSKKNPGVEYDVKTPIKRNPISRYFVKGWWEDMEGKEITEARLGDRIRFHLQMKNIDSPEGKKVHLELREWDKFDFLLYILSFVNKELIGYKNAREYETINIVVTDPENKDILTEWELNENSEIIIPLLLDENALTKMVTNDAGRDLELYFRCRYIDEGNMPEIVELPWENQNYLKVKPKPVAEPIIFVHASDKHLLPAIYSADDGSPWYIAAMKNGLYANKVNTLTKPYSSDFKKEITGFEKRAYKIAIRNLEKNNFFSSIRKGATSEYYYYDISEIDNRFEKEIKKAVNIDSKTSANIPKGINAIEYESGKGLAGKIKIVGEVLGIFGVLSNMAALLRGAADHNVPTPPIIPPFVTMEVEKMMEENNEFIIQHWNLELQKAIMQGKTVTTNFLENNNINREKNLGFKVIDMTEDGIKKILTREIIAIKDSEDSNSPKMLESLSSLGEGNRDSGLLIQSKENLDRYNRLTTFHYIHAIFVNNLKI